MGAGFGVALAVITRPRVRGLNRLLQGSASSSLLDAVGALARTRFAGRSDDGKTPDSNRTKGMYRRAGKQLWNCV